MRGEFGLHTDGCGEARPAAHTEDYLAPHLPLWQESLAGWEWFVLRCSSIYRSRASVPGAGSPVVLIPGLLASDASMAELEGWLRRRGHHPYRSGIGRNARCPELSLAAVVQAVDRAYDETGRKVHVVGHSLGGLLARGASVVRPRQVAQVVTMGTPVNGSRVHPFVAMAAHAVRGECDGECMEALQRPLPAGIAETNIYSRTDGIVDWRTCIRDDATPLAVRGTHIGMIVNTQVYEALDHLLAPKLMPVQLRETVRATVRPNVNALPLAA
jgi:pimeloyl-ACP methyl ester carboxylesterase